MRDYESISLKIDIDDYTVADDRGIWIYHPNGFGSKKLITWEQIDQAREELGMST